MLALLHAADPTGDDFTPEAVGAALRLAPVTAQQRLQTAHDLTERAPATFDALDRGVFGLPHARAILETAL